MSRSTSATFAFAAESLLSRWFYGARHIDIIKKQGIWAHLLISLFSAGRHKKARATAFEKLLSEPLALI